MAFGRKMVVFPYYRGNPYLNLSYLATRAAGTEVVPTRTVGEFVEATAELGAGDVIHVHWTAEIVQNSKDEREGRTALNTFCGAVRSAQDRGVRVMWTVHNRVPHETKWFELERSLSQFLADTADRIVVMSPATAEVVSDVFTIPPEKSFTLPHPSYQGIHVPADRGRSRAELGIPEGLATALFFGQMRSYKGIGTLLESAALASAEGAKFGLLLAGRASVAAQDRIEARMPQGVPVVRHYGFVAHEDVARWFGAADLAVFPYTDILNSGSIHLSATLGVPAAVPDLPHLVDQFGDEDWVHFYTADEGPKDLARLLSDLPSIREMPNSARDFALRTSPYAVSEQLADLVASLHA